MHAQQLVSVTTSAHTFDHSALFLWIENFCGLTSGLFCHFFLQVMEKVQACYGSIWAFWVPGNSNTGNNLSTRIWRLTQWNLALAGRLEMFCSLCRVPCCCDQPTKLGSSNLPVSGPLQTPWMDFLVWSQLLHEDLLREFEEVKEQRSQTSKSTSEVEWISRNLHSWHWRIRVTLSLTQGCSRSLFW